MKGDLDHIELISDAIIYSDLSRRDVRALIFYLMYAMDSGDYQDSLEGIVDNFNRGFNLSIPEDSELVSIAQQVIDERNALDALYMPLLANWRFDRLGVATKLILRYAVWEIEHTEMDPRIIINEAVELAKAFAEDDAYRFVNGVLDRFIKQRVA